MIAKAIAEFCARTSEIWNILSDPLDAIAG